MTAGSGVIHQVVEAEPDHQSNDDAYVKWSEQPLVVEYIAEHGLRRIASDVARVVVAVYEFGKAAADGHGAQCADERRQFEFTDQDTVHNTNREAADQVDQDRENRVHAVADQGRGNHG